MSAVSRAQDTLDDSIHYANYGRESRSKTFSDLLEEVQDPAAKILLARLEEAVYDTASCIDDD